MVPLVEGSKKTRANTQPVSRSVPLRFCIFFEKLSEERPFVRRIHFFLAFIPNLFFNVSLSVISRKFYVRIISARRTAALFELLNERDGKERRKKEGRKKTEEGCPSIFFPFTCLYGWNVCLSCSRCEN